MYTRQGSMVAGRRADGSKEGVNACTVLAQRWIGRKGEGTWDKAGGAKKEQGSHILHVKCRAQGIRER